MVSDVETPDAGLEAALELLEALPGDVGPLLATDDEATAALRRQPLAAITALAWTLPGEEPSPALRERLMARLSGDETQMISPGVLQGVAPSAATDPRRPPTPAVRPSPVEPPRGGPRGAPVRLPAPRPQAVPRRRWAWPAVASLAAAVIALGALTAGLWQELGRTREQLQRQSADRQALAHRVAELERAGGAAAGARTELAALQEQLALVTAATTAVGPLRPPARQPVAPEARGLLYVAADHQHWYLRAQGLAPPGDGRVYHLWFLVGDRPVSAGSLRLEGDEAALTSPTMPEGTHAALVTVESATGLGERPSGPVVLYGNEIRPLL